MNDRQSEPAVLHCWTHEPLTPDVRAVLTRLCHTQDVRHVAVMPDVHLAHDVCVGTVVATSGLILPQAVGSDIGCGMAAVGFECSADVLDDETSAARLLMRLYQTVPVMRQPRARCREPLPELLETTPLSAPPLEGFKRRDGRAQFATLGRGNHFLEFQADQEGRLWLMLHSGSRGIGQAIPEHHLGTAGRTATGLAGLDAESHTGQAYLGDAQWATGLRGGEPSGHAACRRRTHWRVVRRGGPSRLRVVLQPQPRSGGTASR